MDSYTKYIKANWTEATITKTLKEALKIIKQHKNLNDKQVKDLEAKANKWRYNPPPNAINAGIVKRTYLPARKETAFNVAERYNARVDAWREELCSALPVATVNGMIEIYKQSLSYQRLNVLSQTTYTYQLNLLCEMECRGTQLGAYKYDKVTAPMAQKLYEQLCQRGIPCDVGNTQGLFPCHSVWNSR